MKYLLQHILKENGNHEAKKNNMQLVEKENGDLQKARKKKHFFQIILKGNGSLKEMKSSMQQVVKANGKLLKVWWKKNHFHLITLKVGIVQNYLIIF